MCFSRFRGESGYPKLAAAIAASAGADQVERATTVEHIATSYTHLSRSDPFQDLFLTEVNGEVIGYSRGWWIRNTMVHTCTGFWAFHSLVAGIGIGGAMHGWMQDRRALLSHPK